MKGLIERMHSARDRAQGLLREHAEDQATIAALQAASREGHREVQVLQARIAELEQENEVLRAVNTTPEVEQRTGTKEKIDELVSEIDHCLALLTP